MFINLSGEHAGKLGTVAVDRIEPYFEEQSKSDDRADLPTNSPQSSLNLFATTNDIGSDGSYCPEVEQIPAVAVTSKVRSDSLALMGDQLVHVEQHHGRQRSESQVIPCHCSTMGASNLMK